MSDSNDSSPNPRIFTMSGIKKDHSRFKDIVRGKIRENLKKFVTHSEMLGRRGSDKVSIPVPQIDLPRFTFGSRQGGAGQGQGNPGDPVNGQPDDSQEPGEGQKAGKDAADHELEVDVSLEELAQMLGEELSLPRILPKGQRDITVKGTKYTDIHMVGPQSLRHFKRTYREALRRQVASGVYDAKNPIIVPIRSDFRYRGWAETLQPQTNAIILYIMDVSGSMGDEQKEIVRTESFWIDTWLRSQYKGIHRRYIVHDAAAREVDEDTFYRTRESGGTLISSAYKLAIDMLKKDYPSSNWNTYIFHFSDGDNWSAEDTKLCMDILKNEVLPVVNQFSYGQVESRYGSGQFFKDLLKEFGDDERISVSRIEDRDGIYESIKTFLGKGR